MAVYDLEEQEQLDELKSWWKQYQNLVLLVIVAAALTFSGIRGWRYYTTKQALNAGEIYAQQQAAAGAGEQKKVQDMAVLLMKEYPRADYTVLAALAGAKAALESGDPAAARSDLEWVVDHAGSDATRDIARLRLAGVLLEQKNFDEAAKLLAAPHSDSFSALYADLKGDVLVAQGKNDEARSAYQLALDKSAAESVHRTLIQMKLDALGGAK